MTTQTEQKKCDNCSEFGECCQTQPEQEPVGEVSKAGFGDYPVICWRKGYVAKIGDKFYTNPPQRTWVGLTLEEREHLRDQFDGWNYPASLVSAIEAKLKEKNI